MIYILYLLALILSNSQTCDAFSSGAGTCDSGESIKSGHPGSTRGHVDSDSSLSLLINDQVLEHDSIYAINQISNNKIVIQSMDDDNFIGFLLRLEKKNSADNTIGATLNSLSTESRSKGGCDGNVLAMTHRRANSKSEVAFELGFEVGAEYILEVTVVRKRTVWYYSKLEFVQPPKTAAPSIARSSSPSLSSQAPSIVPTSTPTISPTDIPTATPTAPAPTYEPSILPSVSLSSSPSLSSQAPSIVPTSSPTISPTDISTATPTAPAPTYVPSISSSISLSSSPSLSSQAPSIVPTSTPTISLTDISTATPTTLTLKNVPSISPSVSLAPMLDTTTSPTRPLSTNFPSESFEFVVDDGGLPYPCLDSSLRFKITWKEKRISRDCRWVSNRATAQRCKIKGIAEICSETCERGCYGCNDSLLRFSVDWNEKKITRDCTWVGNKATLQRCKLNGVSAACRETCSLC